MKVVEKNGKTYVVLYEGPQPVEIEIFDVVQSHPDGSLTVQLSPTGPVVTIGIPSPPDECLDEDEENEYILEVEQEGILSFLFERDGRAHLSEIVEHLNKSYDIRTLQVRQHLYKLIKEQLVTATGDDIYELTKSGMAYLGVSPPGLFYECVEDGLLKALDLVTSERLPEGVNNKLYNILSSSIDCLRELGKIYQEEWDVDVPPG